MKTFAVLTFLLLSARLAAVEFDSPARIDGRTDKDPLSYEVGEKIVFTLRLADLGREIPAGSRIKWRRSGDDGKVESGEVVAGKEPFKVETSLSKCGFVRLRAELVDGSGKVYPRKGGSHWAMTYGVFFDGSAAARPYEAKQYPEPKDFDSFWARRKARLASLPMKIECVEIPTTNGVTKTFAVSVNCAGPRPVTGYMTVPVDAYTKGVKYPASVTFAGYAANFGQPKPPLKAGPKDRIRFSINAHGYELGREKEYYTEFCNSVKSAGRDYAFDKVQNSNPDQAYFSGMTYRVMRAVAFLKTLKEWNGRDLSASGASQGGLQAIWAASLCDGVTSLYLDVPWSCDLARSKMGRHCGRWAIEWTEALGYYDPVNMIKRMPRNCRFTIGRAGLGDYICPPSGLALLYKNAAAREKSICYVQGSTHGYVPPEPRQTHVDRAVEK